jgi:prepilin-type N-terminal cleavage/methylation domain-containing protein
MRAAPVISSKKGFTLIELMIAVFIIAISMLAMVSSMMTAIRVNVDNDARNTAIRLTNQTAEILHALQWANVGVPLTLRVDAELSAGLHTRVTGDASQDAKGFPALQQSIRNFRQDYRIQWNVEDRSLNTKRITIAVLYTRSGQNLNDPARIPVAAGGTCTANCLLSNVMVVFRNITQ